MGLSQYVFVFEQLSLGLKDDSLFVVYFQIIHRFPQIFLGSEPKLKNFMTQINLTIPNLELKDEHSYEHLQQK